MEEARIWFYFVSSCIMSSRHLSTVYQDKTVLVFAILKGLRFDLGYFIRRSILEAAWSKSMGGITHPHLITTLCLRAGVEILDHEEQVKAMLELPIRRLRAPAGKASMKEPREAEEDLDGGEDRVIDNEDEVAPNNEGLSKRPEMPAHPSTPASDVHVMEYLHSMNERQEAYIAEQREQHDRLMSFLQTMRGEHEFDFREQRAITNRISEMLDVLFRN